MNKSQRNSLVALVITILLLVFCVTILFAWFSEAPILKLSPLILFILTYLVMGLSVIFLRRKQNPAEVDYDERDTIIKQKAIFISYITLWILVLIGCTVPVVLYERGIIPETAISGMAMLINILPVVLFLIFVIVSFVYSLTVLIQYGWGRRNGEN